MTLPYRLSLCGLMLAGASGLCERQARGQGAAALADEIIIISSGQRAKERGRDSTTLGPVHGTAERPFPKIAGADEARLGGRTYNPRPVDVLSAASQPNRAGAITDRRTGILPPALPEPSAAAIPLYGPLELSAIEDEGPEGGLTLEQAMGGVIRSNPELAVKFQEIPKAQADILTAGLWGNPLVFASAGNVPYGKYSPQRPGSNTYGVTIVQPFDVNGKLRARTRLAETAKNVLQAQYQDAVRLELEKLHLAWIDALNARTSVQYLKTSLDGYGALLTTIQERVTKKVAPESDLDTAVIQQETAIVAYEEAVTRYRQAKRNLTVLLGVPSAQGDGLDLRGTIRDLAPPPLRPKNWSASRSASGRTSSPTGSGCDRPWQTSTCSGGSDSRTSSPSTRLTTSTRITTPRGPRGRPPGVRGSLPPCRSSTGIRATCAAPSATSIRPSSKSPASNARWSPRSRGPPWSTTPHGPRSHASSGPSCPARSTCATTSSDSSVRARRGSLPT